MAPAPPCLFPPTQPLPGQLPTPCPPLTLRPGSVAAYASLSPPEIDPLHLVP